MHDAYPTAIELAEFLVDSQVLSGYPVDYTMEQSAIDTAIDVWEQKTQWMPFIGETVDSSTDFRDWHLDSLDFNGGYISITSVSFDGKLMTEFADYRVFPANSFPKRYIRLFTAPNQIVTVVGKKGYGAGVPNDVFRAILSYSASLVWTQLNPQGVLDRVTQGDVTYVFSQTVNGKPTNQFAQWQQVFTDAIQRYKRGWLS